MPVNIVFDSFIAGILASLACGLGVLPLLFPKLNLEKRTGLGYGIAGGLMFSASVYNLLLPGLSTSGTHLSFNDVAPIIIGIGLGAAFIWFAHAKMETNFDGSNKTKASTRGQLLIFLAMAIHSIPEGIAVGVGYASGEVFDTDFGSYIALAIGIHNIPEGLAVAIPMRAAGATINRCFWAAVLTSIPQPIAAIPASLASWFFQPLMPVLMGFAAGAMIYLVLLELIPVALEQESPSKTAWFFTIGFCAMLLVQVIL
ncbi:MAG: ZIP family metal transporter [Calditrichaeota bacterium]|nr:ZIP family metal transporter [Calditrichota bacterium]